MSDSSGNRPWLDAGQARIAARELEVMQEGGEPLRAQRQRDADDDLVEPEPDAEQRHQRAPPPAARRAAEEAEPDRPGQ